MVKLSEIVIDWYCQFGRSFVIQFGRGNLGDGRLALNTYNSRPPLSYGELWRTSFQLTWRRKSLWLWGFLVAGGPVAVFQFFAFGPSMTAGFNTGYELMQRGILAYFLWMIFVVSIYFAFDSFFSPILIYSAAETDKSGDYSLGSAVAEGAAQWSKFLAFGFLSLGVILIVIGAMTLGAMIASKVADILGVLVFVLLCPVALIAILAGLFVFVYARRVLVVEQRGFFESIADGWRFLIENKAPTAIVTMTIALIWFGFSIVAGVVLMISMFSSGGMPDPENFEPLRSTPLDWVFDVINIVVSTILMTVTTILFTLLFLRRRTPLPERETYPPPYSA